jgi:hypothetical protein
MNLKAMSDRQLVNALGYALHIETIIDELCRRAKAAGFDPDCIWDYLVRPKQRDQ